MKLSPPLDYNTAEHLMSLSTHDSQSLRRTRSWSGPVAAERHQSGSLSYLGPDEDAQSTTKFSDKDVDVDMDSLNAGIESWGQQPFWHGAGHRPRIYNSCNLLTSDIVVRFGGGRYEFYSEKAILSKGSEFFKRAFAGAWQVATSDVIDLGDDESTKHIYAMLRFLHGTSYTTIHQRQSMGSNLDFHIDMYLLGEQFDIRSLRCSAAETFFQEGWFLSNTRWFFKAAQRILGPDAPALADKHLEVLTIKLCAERIEYLVRNDDFLDMVNDGEMMDPEMTTKTMLELGYRIRTLTGIDNWISPEERLVRAQAEMIAAEAALGPQPRSTLAGQILAARAHNANTMATSLGMPSRLFTVAPPPPPAAASTDYQPLESSTSIRYKVGQLKKKLLARLRGI